MSKLERTTTVLFAGGGTGGHLFPALAMAESLTRADPGIRVIFAGTRTKIEAQIVPKHGYEFHAIWISGFRRTLAIDNVLFPVKALVSLLQSFFLIRDVQPHVVVGTGGYVCGPVLFAASLLGVPTVLHESNSYPGVTTRLLASRATKVLITFEATRRWLRATAANVKLVGTPTRDLLDRGSRDEAMRHFGLNPKKHTLLVFGGSLGAASINTAILQCLAELRAAGIQIIWQTGAADYERIAAGVTPDGVWLGRFIDAMELAFAGADLALCRAGATTVAELARLGLPAILVPYPHAAADHQMQNARTMEKEGAAVVIRDSDIAGQALGAILALMNDEAARTAMRTRSKILGRPDAGAEIAATILSIAHRS